MTEEELTTQFNGFKTEYLSFRCIVVGKRKYIVVPDSIELNIVKENGDFVEVKNRNL